VANYTVVTKWKCINVNSSPSNDTENCLKCDYNNTYNECVSEFCYFSIIRTIPKIVRRLVTFKLKHQIKITVKLRY